MKKAIVVGATSGIGKGLAEKLADNGFRVGITGRRIELLEVIRAKNEAHFEVKQIDVTKPDAVTLLEELVQKLGGVDIVIISSGTGDINKKLDFEIEKRAIDVNVIGFTAIADWVFNYFQKMGRGHLVAISSVASLRGAAESPAYNATKAYQTNYLEALSVKAFKIKQPITITDIRPGFVDTDMAKGDGLFWVSSVEKVVDMVYRAIVKKKRVLYVTKRWNLIAFVLNALPYSIYKYVG